MVVRYILLLFMVMVGCLLVGYLFVLSFVVLIVVCGFALHYYVWCFVSLLFYVGCLLLLVGLLFDWFCGCLALIA